MSALFELVTSVVAVVFVFGLVIFLHEGGHFVVCKLLGVRVEKFAFGFGPEAWGFDRGGTRYAVHWLPLGGFVKPAGESLDAASGKPDEYFSKPWYQRLAIVYAGPAMNYILAFVVFAGLFWIVGVPTAQIPAVIGETMEGYPAAEAGLRPGDEIVAVNGEKVEGWETLATTIHGKAGEELDLSVRRGEETLALKLTPKEDPVQGVGLIGIRPEIPDQMDYEPVPFLESLSLSARYCWEFSYKSIATLAGALAKRAKPDVAGPVGIIQTVHEVKKSGIVDLLHLMGLISVAVGFFNLLPIPLLDGGHAMLFIWEGVSRRPLTERVFRVTSSVGIVILLTILIFATYSDFVRIAKDRRAVPQAPKTAP